MTPTPLITSTDNPRFRELTSLATSVRDRRQAGRTLLDGVHLVATYQQRRGPPRLLVVSSSGRHRPEVAALLAACPSVESLVFSDALFRRLSTVDNPTGIVAVIRVHANGAMTFDRTFLLAPSMAMMRDRPATPSLAAA